VTGKQNILVEIADAALGQPDGVVREVLFPVAGEQTPHDLVKEWKGVRMLFAQTESFEVCGKAQNGMEAIRMVPELSPDVVILYLSMPGMNGFETAAKIRQIAPSIRIVIFSAHEIPSTALWIGAYAFVSKSSALQDLVLTVNRVLQLGENLQAQQKSSGARAGGG
jgi:DNA-binding NarL/FixJ family response regulator